MRVSGRSPGHIAAAAVFVAFALMAGACQLVVGSPPSMPQSVAASPGSTTATVTWTAPASSGTTPILGYVVGYGTTEVVFNSTATGQTITGLTPGAPYTFWVRAFNAYGRGAFGYASAVTTSTSAATPMWHADADVDVDAGSGTRFWNKEANNLSRLSIVNDPKGLYGRAYRAYLTPTDIASGSNRAEFSQAFLGDGTTELRLANDVTPLGSTQNVWFGWRSLFGSSVVADASHSNDGNFMQLKGDSSCGGPAVGLTIKYGRLTLRSELYLTAYQNIAWNGPSMSTMVGSWHSFVIHVQFSKLASVGYLEVWLDGTRQMMTNGQMRIYFPTLCPNDTYIYPKLGVYGMNTTIGVGPEHWFESARIGTSYEAVVPR